MRKLPFMALGLLLAAACGSKVPGGGTAGDTLAGGADYELVETPASHAGSGKLWTKNIGRYNEVFNDSNYVQYASAERLGIDPIHTVCDAYNTRRPLLKIESGPNYEVDNLTHSMPFLVPEAAQLLDDIGRRFGDIVEERGGSRENNRLLVTSLLRSAHSVKRLRRVNRNAVDSSTHMFATTFDISWSNFHFPDSSKAENAVVLKGILAEVLNDMRNEGRCWVKFERKTPCFHITVR